MNPVELQKAIFARLGAFAALTALVSTRIYDQVPQNATFPYVVIGEDTSAAWRTHDKSGSDNTVTIHVWSRYRGELETKQVQKAIYDALHRYALSVSGSRTVDCEWEFAQSFLDPDGLTRHGVQRFRVILDEA